MSDNTALKIDAPAGDAEANRRKFPRIAIRVPVHYSITDPSGTVESELMGVVLDVSLGGLLLESRDFISASDLSVHFLDIQNQIQSMPCRMVYSRKASPKKVFTGVRFIGTVEERVDFVCHIIRAYFYRKKRLVA